MNAVIIILGIIFLIIIIIFLSLISYNMYKLSHINNQQQDIIKIINDNISYNMEEISNTKNEQQNIIRKLNDNTGKRFSNSIFMINMKNIFFRFNNYLINDILKKICKDAEHYSVKCNEEIKNREFNDKQLKQYNTKINDMWKIIITTIRKIETPFYHKYTDSEINNMIKENISLNKFIRLDNKLRSDVNSTSLMYSMYVRIFDIYIDIIRDLIDYVTYDEELKEILLEKFKYLIESIIINYLGENFEDIKSMFTSGTDEDEGTIDRLITKSSETYNKFNEINIKDQISESANRYYDTPKYRNKKNDVDNKQKNFLQQLRKNGDNYFRSMLDDKIPEKYNNNQITYKSGVAVLDGEKIHAFRLYESAKPDNFTTETIPDFKVIYIKESLLDERAKMIIKDEKYLITSAELLAGQIQ